MVTEEIQRLAFRTQRLGMRCLTREDAPAIHEMQNNETVMKFVREMIPHAPHAAPLPYERVRAGLEDRIARNHLHLMIYLLPAAQHLATPAGYAPYDARLRFPRITAADLPAAGDGPATGTAIANAGMKEDFELGYLVAHAHWGQGYASEAVAGVLREVWRLAGAGQLGELPRDAKGEYVLASVNRENTPSIRVLEKVGAVDGGWKDVEDWNQTKEEKERDGPRMFRLRLFRMHKPLGKLEEVVVE